jgi:leucyl aminopeptidase (aminopeptidase T)
MASIVLSATQINAATQGVLEALRRGTSIEVRTPAGALLVERGTRPLLVDDGVVDAADVEVGATVSNLPDGSVYFTVREDATRGLVELVDGAVLEFGPDGRVTTGQFAGERVSHVGIATNPLVSGSIGWTIVDEHRPGAVFLALGDNRYLHGKNASPINVDLLPASPMVLIDHAAIVTNGELV